MPRSSGLTVAVTGATGELGKPFVRALEQTAEGGRVRAMARRPFDPRRLGWRKTEYRQGDILDRAAVERLVAGVDVVAHLAFIVVKASARSYEINIEGSRNVFGAVAVARVPRLVYTSSLAAYGYHAHEGLLTEATPTHGTERHAYSRQKAEVERVLRETLAGSDTQAYMFRHCIVAGPEAPALLDAVPYLRVEHALPDWARRALRRMPGLRPVLPDHGVPFQLVHHDDVAAAMRAAVLGRGAAGIYNLAGAGRLTVKVLAEELGWYSIPVPELAVDAVAEMVTRLGFLPAQVQWISAFREPVIMDTAKARRELRWRPKHDSLQTLRETITAARVDPLIR
jgi:UDP-glucose 4-epimerase